MKFVKIQRQNPASSIIINMDYVEVVHLNTQSQTAKVVLHSKEIICLAKQELTDFLKRLSEYNENLKSQLLSHIIEE